MFYLGLAILAIIPVVLLVPAILNRRKFLPDQQAEINIRAARERLEALQGAENGESDEDEIHAALLEELKHTNAIEHKVTSPFSGLVFLALVPVAAFLIYFTLGSPDLAVEGPQPPEQSVTGTPDLGELLRELEIRLQQEPDNARGWELAAETYLSLGDFSRARHAFEKLNSLVPGNPNFLTGWADAEILYAGNTYTPRAQELIRSALAVDPEHVNALWISGIGLASLGEYEASNAALERLLPLLGADSESRSQVLAVIDENLSNLPAEMQSGSSPEPEPSMFVQAEVSVSIDTGQLTDSSVVYVVARAVGGMPAPLAVARLGVGELPATVRLDDNMAMIPGHTLSSAENIEIVARISRDGSPSEKPGDLTSAVQRIDGASLSSGQALQLDIDRPVAVTEP